MFHLLDGVSFAAQKFETFYIVQFTYIQASMGMCLVVSNSATPWTPARFLCPWDFPGKNTGVGCHFLLPGIFLTQGLNWVSYIGKQILCHCAIWEAHIQAYLGYTAGLVPDHCSKAVISVKQVTWIFWFPSAYESYIYTKLCSVSNSIMSKNSVHTLIKILYC